MSATIVQQLAEFAASVGAKGLPAHLREDAARRVLDVLGNSLAGTGERPAQAVAALVREWGGDGRATAIGLGERLPAPSAALVNGTLAHSLDFDDTHLPSVLHPSASVVPAAPAVAEPRSATGAQLLDAIGVGVEITVRLGMAGYDGVTRQLSVLRTRPARHRELRRARRGPVVLRVRLRDGQVLEERVDANRGGPQNPLSAEELATKFRLNAGAW